MGASAHRWSVRLGLAASAIGLGVLLSACGGGAGPSGASRTATTTAGPAANIDPHANGVITGPINQARSTVSSLNQQQAQEQQQTGGG